MKIYLKIYYLGCDNVTKLQYGFFISISIIYVTQQQHKICTQITHAVQGDDNTDSATRSQHVQSLVTHGITDEAAYLSEATK